MSRRHDASSGHADTTVGSLLREVARAPDVALSEPEQLPAGARLGPYALIAPIGSGGMGQVYRARDTRLGRDVAVKVLPREYADNPDRRRRFEQEARATAVVEHPNVLAIHDAGTENGTPYLVFELLEGETLRQRISRGALPLRQAVELAAQIARGLAAAHSRGITHRDLKPDNVFVLAGDRVKLLDFGLAKAMHPDDRVPGAASTAPGVVMGTVGYMSPEQVRGEPPDHRTDLFALGVVMYEMLSGRRAFEGGAAVQVMSAILTDEPRPIALVAPATPPMLDRIVHRCLAKHPGDRYQSAGDLAFQLEGVLASFASAPQPANTLLSGGAPTVTHRSWVAWTALVTALIALALSIAALAGGRTRDELATAAPASTAPASAGSPNTLPTASPSRRPAPVTPAASTPQDPPESDTEGVTLRPDPTSRVATASSGEDRHWLQSDDYFISERPWQSAWMHVHLAKRMKQPENPSAKGEVLFFRLDNSEEIWVSEHWKTHAAAAIELALGMLAICFEGNRRDNVYRAPKDKDLARTGSWFMGKITDVSDLPKGWVRVHTYNCAVDSIRVSNP